MRYLYMLVALLSLAVVACDHYMINVYLNEIVVAQEVNGLELVNIYDAENAIRFAHTVAFVANKQANDILRFETQMQKATAVIKGLQLELEGAKQVIIEDGATIKELIDQNSALQNGGRLNDDSF